VHGLSHSEHRGSKVYRFDGAPEVIEQMRNDLYLMDFWGRYDVQAPLALQPKLESYFQQHNLSYHVHIADLEQHFNDSMVPSTAASDLGFDPFFDAYRTYEQMRAEMERYQTTYNGRFGLTVSLQAYPTKTFNGNTIWYSAVTGRGGITTTKKAVFWEGCIHAREWISCMTMMFAMNQLLELYAAGNADVVRWMDGLVIYITPVVNVDGFLWTWSNNRNWRKTRSTYPGTTCIGTDPNRNWDTSGWGTVGGSTDPCSDTYFGPSRFSERCVQAVSNFLMTNQNWVQFVDWHTYGNMFFSPYGFQCSLPPQQDYNYQYAIDRETALAIAAVYRTTWTYGTICNTIYAVGGGSTDWAYLQNKLRQSFGAELLGNTFSPPASSIILAGQETWAGMKILLQYAITPQ